MPANNVAKIFYVFSPFWLIQCWRIVLIYGGGGGGGGNLSRFWTNKQTFNLGRSFYWKTPKTYENDANSLIFLDPNFFLFLPITRQTFLDFTYYPEGRCIPGLQWQLPHHPRTMWEKRLVISVLRIMMTGYQHSEIVPSSCIRYTKFFSRLVQFYPTKNPLGRLWRAYEEKVVKEQWWSDASSQSHSSVNFMKNANVSTFWNFEVQ